MASRARAAIVIALIVICSALAGAAVDRYAFAHTRHRPQFGPGGPNRGNREQDAKRRTEIMDRMTKELGLSATQRAGIDSVMRQTDSLLRSIRLDMQPRLTKVFEDSHAEVHARLDSAQRVKFEAMMPRRPSGDSTARR